jgi:hypothetical protein
MRSTVKYSEIKTPTTVEEFRDNLLKYYFSIGRDLYVNELDYINVDKINSMKDISDLMLKKYGRIQFQITPLVIQTESWISFSKIYGFDYLLKGIRYVGMKWWLNPKNNIIYKRNLKTEVSPMENFSYLSNKYGDGQFYWKPFFIEGNDNFVEFYVKTLGEFSGYETDIVEYEEQRQSFQLI